VKPKPKTFEILEEHIPQDFTNIDDKPFIRIRYCEDEDKVLNFHVTKKYLPTYMMDIDTFDIFMNRRTMSNIINIFENIDDRLWIVLRDTCSVRTINSSELSYAANYSDMSDGFHAISSGVVSKIIELGTEGVGDVAFRRLVVAFIAARDFAEKVKVARNLQFAKKEILRPDISHVRKHVLSLLVHDLETKDPNSNLYEVTKQYELSKEDG